MSNVLYKIFKIPHEKALNARWLHWFHYDTLAEKNSLHGHSNESWING